ncbi:YheC/YheD family protein [Bacillus spongiae]|uniref:YheC/YheD family protein n=1 Tax=Bacillus spongiae TaxID=2683610 RepID=A0ABU8HAS2_9BACI
MTKLGIMTLTPYPVPQAIDEIGKRSLDMEVEVFIFSPLSIDPYSENVTGYHYDENEWKKTTMPIPTLIYDRCFYNNPTDSQQAKRIVQWLKNRKDTLFIGYGLPDKWKMHTSLTNSPSLSAYLIDTEYVMNAESLLSFLQKHKHVIMKPIDGAGGFAVYGLSLQDKHVVISMTKEQVTKSKSLTLPMFSTWVNALIKKHDFIVQKRIQSKTKNHEPFDIRIFLQKDEYGHWQKRGLGVRCGKEYSLLTNLHAGAEIIPLKTWKKSQKHLQWEFIFTELQDLIASLPVILEETFAPLFELGIDILIGEDSSIWICDINSKPGRTLIEKLYPDTLETLYYAPLQYCKHVERHWLNRSPLL